MNILELVSVSPERHNPKNIQDDVCCHDQDNMIQHNTYFVVVIRTT